MRIARALASGSIALIALITTLAAMAGAAPPAASAPSAGGALTKGLSQEQIRTVMRAHAVAFNACLASALHHNPELHGPFLYDLEVDKRGVVTAARPFAPSPVASFDQCILAVLKRARFPGGPASVEAPLVFDAD